MPIKIKYFLDLAKIFKKLEHKDYCIIKLPPTFPSYDIGSDLDIFCYNIQSVSKIILSNVQELVTSEIKIKIITACTQVYIDIMHNNAIHFRFDLYETLPFYKNISIKNAFFSSVIENSKNININNLNIKIPSDIDEAILRYIEYQEWYSQRPDKIKHIKYLQKKITSNKIDLNKMLDKLHYYTSIPNSLKIRKVKTRSTKEKYFIIDLFTRIMIKSFRTVKKLKKIITFNQEKI